MKKENKAKGRPNKWTSAALPSQSKAKETTIEDLTKSYEAWMRSGTHVLQSDLRSKHEQNLRDIFLQPNSARRQRDRHWTRRPESIPA